MNRLYAVFSRAVLVVNARCRNCGAPLSLAPGQQHVICAYCSTSFVATSSDRSDGAGGAPVITPDKIPPESIQRIKDLVLDGKREEAIGLYAQLTGNDAKAAQTAVDQLLLPSIPKLLRDHPITPFAIVLGTGIITGALTAAIWGALNASAESPGYGVLAAFASFVALIFVRWIIPKLRATWVHSFGREGSAAVVKRSILRPNARPGGTLVLCMFEVRPKDGSADFLDQEAIMVRDESMPKLEPGNVIRVRFNSLRNKVYPVSPIEVLHRVEQ